ncbi:MAG: hypothetical protein KIT83_22190 [Bryobacterales bacterium]|nr:hypothetical protein [Bryobacterales bacterium]
MISYSVRNHSAFFTANYQINPKTSLFANVVYNDGRGSMGNINFNPALLVGQPVGFDYIAAQEIGRYSALSIGRTQQMYGVNQQVAPNWVLSLVGYYSNYRDRQPYLFDANGRTVGVHGGLSYTF